jgi:hypothetical protein
MELATKVRFQPEFRSSIESGKRLLVTRDGRLAKIISWVHQDGKLWRLLVSIEGTTPDIYDLAGISLTNHDISTDLFVQSTINVDMGQPEYSLTKVGCLFKILALMLNRAIIPLSERVEIYKVLEEAGLCYFNGEIMEVSEFKNK